MGIGVGWVDGGCQGKKGVMGRLGQAHVTTQSETCSRLNTAEQMLHSVTLRLLKATSLSHVHNHRDTFARIPSIGGHDMCTPHTQAGTHTCKRAHTLQHPPTSPPSTHAPTPPHPTAPLPHLSASSTKHLPQS